jgi:cytochrome c-type biogenesis protein CcmH
VKACLALAAAAATAALLASAAPAAPPNAADLEAEIVCPVCKTTLDQSNAEIARRMKALIRQRIAEGATEQQIKAELVDQFGPAVLAEPPKRGFDLLAWVLPIGGAVLGAVAVGVLAWSWSRRRRDELAPEIEVDPELERRVDQALRELDE